MHPQRKPPARVLPHVNGQRSGLGFRNPEANGGRRSSIRSRNNVRNHAGPAPTLCASTRDNRLHDRQQALGTSGTRDSHFKWTPASAASGSPRQLLTSMKLRRMLVRSDEPSYKASLKIRTTASSAGSNAAAPPAKAWPTQLARPLRWPSPDASPRREAFQGPGRARALSPAEYHASPRRRRLAFTQVGREPKIPSQRSHASPQSLIAVRHNRRRPLRIPPCETRSAEPSGRSSEAIERSRSACARHACVLMPPSAKPRANSEQPNVQSTSSSTPPSSPRSSTWRSTA